MKKLILLVAIVSSGSLGCGPPQRFHHNVPDDGFAHALECLQNEGDEAAVAVRACGRRDFHPGAASYAEGWRAALDCARSESGSTAEVIRACGSGA
jgi:hypothetical protein